jgi:hypothetical protein
MIYRNEGRDYEVDNVVCNDEVIIVDGMTITEQDSGNFYTVVVEEDGVYFDESYFKTFDDAFTFVKNCQKK